VLTQSPSNPSPKCGGRKRDPRPDKALIMNVGVRTDSPATRQTEANDVTTREYFRALRQFWFGVFSVGLFAAALGYAGSFALRAEYTTNVSLLPPQSANSLGGAGLASLGAIAGLVGGSSSSSAERYVALLQSVTIADRITDL
jgi:uncharacterized protein involved in exopolysaccharide biosynthesis